MTNAERSKLWRINNPEKAKESSRLGYLKWKENHPGERQKSQCKAEKKYYAKNSIFILAKRKQYRKENPEYMKQVLRKSNYDLTEDAFQKMLLEQNNCCKLCKEPFFDETPCVDHCHLRNEIRGLLHKKCNTAIGMLEDNPEKCKLAAAYLESSLKTNK